VVEVVQNGASTLPLGANALGTDLLVRPAEPAYDFSKQQAVGRGGDRREAAPSKVNGALAIDTDTTVSSKPV